MHGGVDAKFIHMTEDQISKNHAIEAVLGTGCILYDMDFDLFRRYYTIYMKTAASEDESTENKEEGS